MLYAAHGDYTPLGWRCSENTCTIAFCLAKVPKACLRSGRDLDGQSTAAPPPRILRFADNYPAKVAL